MVTIKEAQDVAYFMLALGIAGGFVLGVAFSLGVLRPHKEKEGPSCK